MCVCVCMWVCASFVCTHVCVCVVHVSYSIHNPVVKGQSIYKYKYAVGVHVRVQSGVLYNPVMPTLLPPQTRRLLRVQWQQLRRLMGKPRRCSPTFFQEERALLEYRRNKVRGVQQQVHQGVVSPPSSPAHSGLAREWKSSVSPPPPPPPPPPPHLTPPLSHSSVDDLLINY